MAEREKRTAYGRRVFEALAYADLSQTAAARMLTERLGREVKPQTVQYLASKAEESALTADLAQLCHVRYDWLAHGRGKMEEALQLAEPVAVYQVGDREYEFVKRVRGAVLSAGPGSVTFEVEEIDQSHAFRREWLRKRGLKPERCRVMEVHGESMDPYLADGDVVLVNLDDQRIQDGEVYAIAVDHEAKIKRLFKLTGGRIEVRSDNTSAKYRAETIEADQLERLQIIGRVVWRGG